MTYLDVVLVGIGGFLGAVTRYFIAMKMNGAGKMPTGTLIVDLMGAFLIGFIVGLDVSRWLILFLVSGLAGALTTFSTMNKELIELWKKGERHYAIRYFLLTYGGGVSLTLIGYLFSKTLFF